MTAPNTGTESWEVNTANAVTWTKKGAITAVKLQYTTDGGAIWAALVDGTTPTPQDTQNIDVTGVGPYTFNWVIPDVAGITTTQARLRVVDAADATVLDPANANFTIKGRVQLTTPNGGETLTVGVPYGITGNVYGPITGVNLFVSTDGGLTYTQLAAGNCDATSVSAGTFSCNWNVQDLLDTDIKIKVADASNPLVADESNAVFSIKGSATVSAPAGGNILIAGEPFTITWDRTGTIGNVDLSYNVNNGAYTSIAAGVASPNPTGNTYAWTVPSDQIVSANVKIKIDGVNLVAPAISGTFSVKGKLTLTYPDVAGIERTLGDTMNVTWNVAGDIGNVTVDYFNGTAWSTITTTAPQAGPYGLLLDTPNTTAATNAAKVRISDADDATVTDESANAFLVRPFLQVTSPAGDEAWVVNSTHPITWNYKGSNVSNVEVRYSKDSGATYTDVIALTTANDGSHDWVIPDDIQTVKNMKIKVSTLPLADPWAVTALSTGLFQITGALEMVTSNDSTGIKWRIDTTANEIKWNATGSIVNVRLEYSVNGVGGPWVPIVASTPSGAGTNKTYAWNIAGTVPLAKDTVRIRACDQANTSVCDVATANSSFLGNFTFVTPTPGAVWVAETANDVTWTTPQAGVPTNVKLEYTLDGTIWSTITSSTINSGSLSWTLPFNLSNAAKLRISDALDADSAKESSPFKIRGDLTVTAPNTGTESWEIDTVHPVTWTKKGNITAAKLQLSTDGGLNYSALVDGTTPTPQGTQNIDISGAGPYTFNWDVPDVAGITTPQARIRVVDASDATVMDNSNANFTIKGRVQLSTPNGGETLTVGQAYNITGTVFGPIPSVKLFYSTDGLSFTNPVVGCEVVGVSGSGFSCSWSVPDAIGTTLKVRVEDAGNPLVNDASDAVFAIKGAATITDPTTGNIWVAGDVYQIRWNRSGAIGNVDLSYSVNSGAWLSIATGLASPLPSGNSYDWTVPSDQIVSSNVKVRAEGINLVTPAESAAFSVKGKLTLTYPDAAGIIATLGDTLNVAWNVAGDIGDVKVDYYNGSGWSTITTTAPQAGPFSLLLDAPNTTVATAGAKVRITDADNASVADESANTFMVKPFLQVTGPAGGEAFVVNSSTTITWNKKGDNVASVKIEYSKDGGLTFNNTIAASATNSGSYLWQPIPDDIVTVPSMKVRVLTLPTGDPYATQAVSNNLFKIVGSLTLTTPVADEKWGVGTTRDIKWSRTGSIAQVRLTYSTDGTNYNPIVDNYPGGSGDTGYPWTIPSVAGIVSNTVTIRISDVADSSVSNVSPVFKIVPSFTITAPAIGTRMIASRSTNVTWDRQGQNPTVNLYYSKDAFAGAGIVVQMGASNSGSFLWTVPDDLSNTVTLRITYPADETVFDDSDLVKIVPGFTVVAPNSSVQKWDVGSSQTVRWTCTSANVPLVTFYYSVDSGSTYPFQLTTTADNSGAVDAERTWTWNPMPDTITDSLRVKVVANSDSLALDESDSNAKLKAFFQVLTPSATGIIVKVADVYNVTWNWTGSVANVRLDYSLDDFAGSTNITPTTLNDGVFEWTVPDQITTVAKIRIRSTTDVDAFDISDNAFKIRGNFVVQSPNNAEQFAIGFSHNIQWDTIGTIPTVNVVAYSTNGVADTGFPYAAGAPYTIVNGLANTSNGQTTYAWNPVPDLASPNVKVRIIDVADTTVYDDSDNAFKIQGSFTVTNPSAAGITMPVGTVQAITWNRTGSSITNAKISYSTMGAGGPWTAVQETEATDNDGIVANDGSFGWTVPDAISQNVFIKIEDPNDAQVVDLSDNAFKIRGNLTMVTPAGGERWVTNETHLVSWNTAGTIPSVNLVYSKNDFGSQTVIVAAQANATGLNTYNWVIPNDQSTGVKVRVIDAADATAYGTSNAFTIDLYQITFQVRDLLSNALIGTLTVSGIHSTNPAYVWNESGLNAPVTKGLAAGPWSATWVQSNYGDQSTSFVADQDQTITVLMETKVVHVWEAVTELAYSAGTDTVSTASTLRRDGITVQGASSIEIKFFEPGNSTAVKVFNDPTAPDENGFYNFIWNPPTNLNAGIVYNVITKINLAATGAVITTPRTFSIAQESQLQTVQDNVNDKLDTPLSQVKDDVTNAVSDKLDSQTVVIQSKLDSQKASLDSKLDAQSSTISTQLTAQTSTISTQMAAQTSAIDSKLVSFESKTNEQISKINSSVTDIGGASIELQKNAAVQEGTASRFAGKLVMPASVLVGSQNISIIYLGPRENLIPMLSISYRDKSTGKEVVIEQDVPMSSEPLQPDTYSYVIKKVEAPPYPAGGVVTVRVLAKDVYVNPLIPDKTFDSFVFGSFVVETTTLSTLEGLVAGQSGVKAVAQDTFDAVRALQAEVGVGGHMSEALTNLNTKVDALPKAVSKEGATSQMKNAINEIATQIKSLAGDSMGYDMGQIVGKALDDSSSLKDIRKKADEVQGTTELMQILLESKMGGVDAPVTLMMYE
jgi:hypothetical protein